MMHISKAFINNVRNLDVFVTNYIEFMLGFESLEQLFNIWVAKPNV